MDLSRKINLNANVVFLLCLISVLVSCKSENSNTYFETTIINEQKELITQLEFDTVVFDQINSSYEGHLKVYNNNLFFIDERFCWVYKFDEHGKLLERLLGQGRGPNEVDLGDITSSVFLESGDKLFISRSVRSNIIDEKWKRIENYSIDWMVDESRQEMLKNPKPTMHGLYAPAYVKFISREYSGYIYFPILSQHPTFNFINSDDYFINGRILAKMNLKNGKIVDIIGRHSPIYRNRSIGQFGLINFDISNSGDFYVSQEADSLIYVYDNSYKVKFAFGYKGKDLNDDYLEIKTLKVFDDEHNFERKNKGYYTWIEVFNDGEFVFRSYQKGKHVKSDGLQIYRNHILIGDIDVPKGFRVIGKLGQKFISNLFIDEENEEITIYKFKLELDEI